MSKVLKFYSPLCGPCKVLESNLKASGINYININIFEDGYIKDLGNINELTEHFGIRTVPTLIKIDSYGKELERRVGILSVEQLKEFAK